MVEIVAIAMVEDEDEDEASCAGPASKSVDLRPETRFCLTD
jgi:hypothetical protein